MITRIWWSDFNIGQCCQSCFITLLICFVDTTHKSDHYLVLFILLECICLLILYHTQESYHYMELLISRCCCFQLLYCTGITFLDYFLLVLCISFNAIGILDAVSTALPDVRTPICYTYNGCLL